MNTHAVFIIAINGVHVEIGNATAGFSFYLYHKGAERDPMQAIEAAAHWAKGRGARSFEVI